ncbi:hypothetical protein, partial [Streptomyces sp. NPDC058964]|uniref:hypothetical protein n=1 Tax=Streptomyces sp. NPDC058964 TaxID=3346681 RepID=UPI0036CB1C06
MEALGAPSFCCHSGPVLPGDDPAEAHYGTDTEAGLGDPLPLPARTRPPTPPRFPGTEQIRTVPQVGRRASRTQRT